MGAFFRFDAPFPDISAILDETFVFCISDKRSQSLYQESGNAILSKVYSNEYGNLRWQPYDHILRRFSHGTADANKIYSVVYCYLYNNTVNQHCISCRI